MFGCGTEREVVKLYEWSPQDCGANYWALQAVSSGLLFLRPSLTLAFHRGLMKQEDFDVRLPELKNCKKLSFFSLWLAQLEYSDRAIRGMCWLLWVLLKWLGILCPTPLSCLVVWDVLWLADVLCSSHLRGWHSSLTSAPLSSFSLCMGYWATLITFPLLDYLHRPPFLSLIH